MSFPPGSDEWESKHKIMNPKSISILYEDRDVLVINKPAGLVVHQDGRTIEPSLVDWLLEKYPTVRGVGEPLQLKTENLKLKTILRPGIVHRLDRETSGVMAIAKNQQTFLFLKKQFQDREVEKSYRAFVYGEIKDNEGIIDRPIAKSRKDFRLWSAQRGARGEEREAITEYKVLARHNSSGSDSFGLARNPAAARRGGGKESVFSFLELRPKSGRTHQIRVHLKAINYPVVCDKLYAPKRDCALGFKRLALHAFSLAFTLPSGKPIKIEAPHPEDFKKALDLFDFPSKTT